MNTEVASRLVTLGVFGMIGWLLAQSWRVPVSPVTWLLLLVSVVVGPFVGRNTNLICLNGIGICLSLNWAITSCCVGILAGLLVRAGVYRRNPQH